MVVCQARALQLGWFLIARALQTFPAVTQQVVRVDATGRQAVWPDSQPETAAREVVVGGTDGWCHGVSPLLVPSPGREKEEQEMA